MKNPIYAILIAGCLIAPMQVFAESKIATSFTDEQVMQIIKDEGYCG